VRTRQIVCLSLCLVALLSVPVWARLGLQNILTQLPHFCFSRGRKGAEMLAFADADPNCGAKSPQIPAVL
jgi:hypothetical protein